MPRPKKEEKTLGEPLMAGLEESVAYRNEGGAEKVTRTRRGQTASPILRKG